MNRRNPPTVGSLCRARLVGCCLYLSLYLIITSRDHLSYETDSKKRGYTSNINHSSVADSSCPTGMIIMPSSKDLPNIKAKVFKPKQHTTRKTTGMPQ